MGIGGEGGRTRAVAQTLLVFAGRRHTDCGPDEPNMVQARILNYSLNWTARSSAITKVTTVSMLQFTHTKVAQSKLGTFQPHLCLGWAMSTVVKAYSKLMRRL